MTELLVRNGSIVSEDAVAIADLAIGNGRVEAILPPGSNRPSRAVIDATGLHVLPGLVDAHVHLREPGLVHKEGFATGTMAAAAGGVTTVMVMPTDDPLTMTADAFSEKRALAQGQCHVDFALQAALSTNLDELDRLIELGAVSFEIFMADVPAALRMPDDYAFLRALRMLAERKAIAGVTAGDHEIATRQNADVMGRSTGAWGDYSITKPDISEALGVARACLLAVEAGAHVHFRQISTAKSLAVLKKLKESGRITAEVTPHNLTLDETDLLRLGPDGKVGPPLRKRSDVDAMVEGLRARALDIVATDHAPHLPSEKDAGLDNIFKAPGGLAGLQTFLPVMLSLVTSGAIALPDLVRVCCTEPARIFHLYPRKGALQPGADADFVLVDLQQKTLIRDEDQLSKAARTPFRGREVGGRILGTFLRGQEVARDGKVSAGKAGRFIAPSR